MSQPRYTVVIQWSDEDEAYVVSLPEWGQRTHGETYEEAARNARELLELLVESHDGPNEGALPSPKLFRYPGADVIDLPQATAVPSPSVTTAKSA